ncbi:MAG: YbaK/EbsC family protein [Nanoarchaeota archaeon]|nr:YbaK/EbsC family protein [Nanoarchaeota archaeon]
MKSTDYLKSRNIEFKTIHLDEIPRTAQDVERIYGCPIHQVLKTLIFIGKTEPVIVVLPGDKRVDMDKLKEVTKGNSLRMAKPDEVEEITGYTIGGISPFGIEKNVKKIIDESVFKIKTVNIGSGKAEIGIELNSEELRRAWDGIIANISQKACN